MASELMCGMVRFSVFAQPTTSPDGDERCDIVGGCVTRSLSNTAIVLPSRKQFSQQCAQRELPRELHDVIPLPGIGPVVAQDT